MRGQIPAHVHKFITLKIPPALQDSDFGEAQIGKLLMAW